MPPFPKMAFELMVLLDWDADWRKGFEEVRPLPVLE